MCVCVFQESSLDPQKAIPYMPKIATATLDMTCSGQPFRKERVEEVDRQGRGMQLHFFLSENKSSYFKAELL